MKAWACLLATVVAACSSGAPAPGTQRRQPPNPWSDARLAPVLEAQDHRDGKALLVLLRDSTSVVRQAAAMAFASVQDTTARADLLAALGDSSADVRIAAAWALSFIPDSTVAAALAMVARTDTTAEGSLRIAAFHAWKAARAHRAAEVLQRLAMGRGEERAIVADALRRMPMAELKPVEPAYLKALQREEDRGVKLLLLAGMKNFSDVAAQELVLKELRNTEPEVRVAALRAYVAMVDTKAASALYRAVRDSVPAVRGEAVEGLGRLESVDGGSCLVLGRESKEAMLQAALFGLALHHGSPTVRGVADSLLKAMWAASTGPYVRAALINARAWEVGVDTLLAWMQGARPAIERQAAFSSAMTQVREQMERSRYPSRKEQYAGLVRVIRAAFTTGDAGLIASAMEEVAKVDASVIAEALDPAMERGLSQRLHPIQDLEARQLLAQLVAKRDGRPGPVHQAPPWNHPIRMKSLRGLEQGARYRIVTNKGEVVIALEPDAAPGTCVAFDSLVTAGFYNGKYFHRVVPNFVAQGGCPRGDGYGAMDWTLRTEVGWHGFSTGAVGMASAGKDTESCQFFITLAPAPHLDGRYTRFAHVVSGMDVAQKLVVGDEISRVVPMP